jgi:hypothetical protein
LKHTKLPAIVTQQKILIILNKLDFTDSTDKDISKETLGNLSFFADLRALSKILLILKKLNCSECSLGAFHTSNYVWKEQRIRDINLTIGIFHLAIQKGSLQKREDKETTYYITQTMLI